MIYCATHRVREADFHCAQCQTGYCKDCISLRAFDRGKVEVCPVCGNVLKNLAPYRAVPPFWRRIKEVLLFPVQEHGWWMLLGWSAFALVVRGLGILGMKFPGSLGWAGGFVFLMIYFSVLISYFYRVVAKSEEGKFSIPEWSEFRGLGGSLLWTVIQFYLAIFASFWPSVLCFVLAIYLGFSGTLTFLIPVLAILGILFGLFGIFLWPMALLMIGVFRSLKLIFNPIVLIAQVRKIVVEYFILLLFLVALSILYTIVGLIALIILSPLGGFGRYVLYVPVDSVLQLYLFMVLGHLFGYLAYQTRFKLKWWPETMEEPVFMVQGIPAYVSTGNQPSSRALAGLQPAPAVAAVGVMAAGAAAAAAVASAPGQPGRQTAAPRPGQTAAPRTAGMAKPTSPAGQAGGREEMARNLAEAMSLLEHGRHEDAEAMFKAILELDRQNLGALRGMVLASLGKNDHQAAQNYAEIQATLLAKDKAFEPMWELYGVVKKQIKDFAFQARNQMLLARWLSQQRMDMDAARLLREVAVKFPADPLSPNALYQCGDILWKRLEKPEAAVQMFEYILKRYPEVAFAAQVSIALKELKSSAPS